jgi:hypothetical protein
MLDLKADFDVVKYALERMAGFYPGLRNYPFLKIGGNRAFTDTCGYFL